MTDTTPIADDTATPVGATAEQLAATEQLARAPHVQLRHGQVPTELLDNLIDSLSAWAAKDVGDDASEVSALAESFIQVQVALGLA